MHQLTNADANQTVTSAALCLVQDLKGGSICAQLMPVNFIPHMLKSTVDVMMPLTIGLANMSLTIVTPEYFMTAHLV